MITDKKAKLAIIDDEKAARDSLYTLLKSMDCDVMVFDSTESFLDIFEERNFDCIVTDLRLKGKNGIELIKAVHDSGSTSQTILLSAFAKTNHISDAYRYGVLKVLDKPYEEQDLWDTINEALILKKDRDKFEVEKSLCIEMFNNLTATELETLELILKGKNNKEISFKLGLTQRTIELRKKNIIEKFKANNISQVCVKLAKIDKLLALADGSA